jgi:hypothetical protein
MTIAPITIEAQGLEQVAAAIKLLEEAIGPRSYNAVQLLDPGRDDETTNVKILTDQRDLYHRDVVTADEAESVKIGQAYADRIILEVDRVLKRKESGKATTGRESVVIDRLALTDAMKAYLELISSRIEKQIDASGGRLTPLSQAYAAWKKRKWGFSEPILKASGQLIEAVNPSKPSLKFVK